MDGICPECEVSFGGLLLRESHAGEPMFREVRVYGGGVYRVAICHNKMREKINFEVLSCSIEGCPL